MIRWILIPIALSNITEIIQNLNIMMKLKSIKSKIKVKCQIFIILSLSLNIKSFHSTNLIQMIHKNQYFKQVKFLNR